MAVEAPARATPPEPSRGALGYKGRDRPAGGFELWSWLFMRISGIVLLVLAVGHVLIMHVLDDGVDRVDFGFVAARWGSVKSAASLSRGHCMEVATWTYSAAVEGCQSVTGAIRGQLAVSSG